MVALKSDPTKSLPDRVLALLERVNYRRADIVEERGHIPVALRSVPEGRRNFALDQLTFLRCAR
jgi:hypothetical protein